MSDMISEQSNNEDIIKEIARERDENLASFYRTIVKIDRDVEKEREPDVMYGISGASLSEAFEIVLGKDTAKIDLILDSDEIEMTKNFLVSSMKAIDSFARENLRAGYMSSSIQFPVNNPLPNEICRFDSSFLGDVTPSAIVYVEEGELKYRFGPKEKRKDIFDLSVNNESINSGEIANYKINITSDVVAKVDKILKGNFEIPENRKVLSEPINYLLADVEEAVRGGASSITWENYDKSFDAQTDSFRAAGNLVFGYVDGDKKFYSANSKENIFEIYKNTGGIEIISYNPQPTMLKVKVEGFDEKTGKPILSMDDDQAP